MSKFNTTEGGARKLAKIRLFRSSLLFALSIVSILYPILYMIAEKTLLPIWLLCICLISSRLLYLYGKELLQLSQRANRGADAEDIVINKLKTLPQNWKTEAGVLFKGLGDIDCITNSPSGKTYAIEVKSHRGEVRISNDGLLYGHIEGKDYEFDHDFLRKTKRLAAELSRQRELAFVIPLIVFTNAKVSFNTQSVEGVYVLEERSLKNFLLAEEK
jgi:hypothetical protein